MTRILPARSTRAASALLGVAMGAANVMSYLFVALLSSTLGPADFGGFSALNTVGILCAMPAGAMQLVVARRQGEAARRDGRATSGAALSAVVGLVLATAVVLLAPALRDAFHLESAASAVWLGLTLVPMTITGAQQGVLLGQGRLGRLSVLYLVTAGTRVVAGAVAVLADLAVHEVFAATCTAAVLTWAAGTLLLRGLATPSGAGPREVLAELVRSNAALAALMALTSLDLLLARHLLTREESGAYALAALFGRVVFWGTQFVALSVVPVAAGSGAGRQRTVRGAGAVVVVLGLLVALVCAVVPGLLVRVTGGAQYADAEPLLVWFAVVGTMWALVQLWLFAEIGAGRSALGWLTLAVVVVEVAAIWFVWHDSPGQVLLVAGLGAGVVAVVGALLVPRDEQTPGPDSPETAEALHATSE